jgi:hypothetical protein
MILARRQQRGVVLSYRSASLNMARTMVPYYRVLHRCSHVQEWSGGPMLHYRGAL